MLAMVVLAERGIRLLPLTTDRAGYDAALADLDVMVLPYGERYRTIGSGIFLTPSQVAGQLSSPGLILSVWAVGGLIALTGALTFAELGAMFPRAGGVYVYLREAFGDMTGFSTWETAGLNPTASFFSAVSSIFESNALASLR